MCIHFSSDHVELTDILTLGFCCDLDLIQIPHLNLNFKNSQSKGLLSAKTVKSHTLYYISVNISLQPSGIL